MVGCTQSDSVPLRLVCRSVNWRSEPAAPHYVTHKTQDLSSSTTNDIYRTRPRQSVATPSPSPPPVVGHCDVQRRIHLVAPDLLSRAFLRSRDILYKIIHFWKGKI
jgi:hypothetical protein